MVESTVARIRDINIRLTSQGHGIPLIWSHGLTSSMAYEEDLDLSVWKKLKRLKLIRFDARGHGLSDATYSPADYLWSSLSKDLLELIQKLRLKRPILGGTSMGCGVSLHAAISKPDIGGLVLANPPTAWLDRDSQANIYYQISETIRIGGIRSLIDQVETRSLPPVYAEIRNKYLEAKIQNLSKMDAKALPEIYMGASRSNLPSESSINKIAIPTIIFAWQGDLMHPLSTAQKLNELIVDSELHVASNLDELLSWPDLLMKFLIKKSILE